MLGVRGDAVAGRLIGLVLAATGAETGQEANG